MDNQKYSKVSLLNSVVPFGLVETVMLAGPDAGMYTFMLTPLQKSTENKILIRYCRFLWFGLRLCHSVHSVVQECTWLFPASSITFFFWQVFKKKIIKVTEMIPKYPMRIHTAPRLKPFHTSSHQCENHLCSFVMWETNTITNTANKNLKRVSIFCFKDFSKIQLLTEVTCLVWISLLCEGFVNIHSWYSSTNSHLQLASL